MKLTITVPGTPVADTRPRITKNGVYDPRAKEKARFRDYAAVQCPEKPLTGPVILSAAFIMDRPKSHYGVRPYCHAITGLKDSAKLKPHIVRPDLDNLLKFVLDALNGIAYEDDKQVVGFSYVVKHYTDSRNPRTIVEIEEV